MTTQDPMIHIREVLERLRTYVAEYEDAPSWGGPTMYPDRPTLADIKAVLAALDQPSLKDDDVERVARAICSAQRGPSSAYDKLDPDGQSFFRDQARAAIEAMSVSSCGSAHG